MEGYRVVTMDYAADKADIFVTATGNFNVITHEHMERMKNNAIVCNIGHFDNEIDIAGAAPVQVGQHQAAGRPRHLPGRQAHHPAGRRAPGEPRLRHRASRRYVMSSSFANQVLAQIELFTNTAKYPVGVYILPKQLDEKVARLQLCEARRACSPSSATSRRSTSACRRPDRTRATIIVTDKRGQTQWGQTLRSVPEKRGLSLILVRNPCVSRRWEQEASAATSAPGCSRRGTTSLSSPAEPSRSDPLGRPQDREPARRRGAKVRALEHPREAGVADVVLFAVKLWDTESGGRKAAAVVGRRDRGHPVPERR